MAIPKYDEMMLPLLQLIGDGAEHHYRDLAPQIADHFRLTDEERNAMLPSTQSTYLRNRLGWAGFHLRKAGLAELPHEATLRITADGKKLLNSPPSKIDRQFLMRFEPFKQFMEEQKQRGLAAARTKAGLAVQAPSSEEEGTPEERIEAAFTESRETLVADLLSQLARVEWSRFEQVVLDVLVAMGYGGSKKEAAAVTQKTGDEGIDGLINQDRLGLDVVYFQAKNWKDNVGRPEIQNFVGALAGKKATKGIFITRSSFNANAKNFVDSIQQKIILIDGRRLAELMIEHGVGVDEEHAYSVKKIDSDYFDEA
jgi:restriction system protein